MKTYDVVWASDKNYLPYMATSIFSFCENNLSWIDDDKKLVIHILEDGFGEEDKEKIVKMVNDTREKKGGVVNIKVNFYDMGVWCEKLKLKEIIAVKNKNGYPPSAYFRLFVGQILPSEVERVLYLDSDSLVLGSFEEVLKMDLEGKVMAGVDDIIRPASYRQKFGLDINDPYINTGVCVIDLNKIREEKMVEKFIPYIKNHEVSYADQDVLNALLRERVTLVHPKFNLQGFLHNHTIEYCSYYTGGAKMFYDQVIVDEAIKNPVFVHDKLWCRHVSFYSPFTKKYWTYFACNPFGTKRISRLSQVTETKIIAISLVRKVLGVKLCDKMLLAVYRFSNKKFA